MVGGSISLIMFRTDARACAKELPDVGPSGVPYELANSTADEKASTSKKKRQFGRPPSSWQLNTVEVLDLFRGLDQLSSAVEDKWLALFNGSRSIERCGERCAFFSTCESKEKRSRESREEEKKEKKKKKKKKKKKEGTGGGKMKSAPQGASGGALWNAASEGRMKALVTVASLVVYVQGEGRLALHLCVRSGRVYICLALEPGAWNVELCATQKTVAGPEDRHTLTRTVQDCLMNGLQSHRAWHVPSHN
ncbi:hypothetical protein Q8A73_010713 [Channa argus]|nr:hypothetical protein Q8A73_010713 [Channa argus]